MMPIVSISCAMSKPSRTMAPGATAKHTEKNPPVDKSTNVWKDLDNPVRWRWIARRGKRKKALNKGLFICRDRAVFHCLSLGRCRYDGETCLRSPPANVWQMGQAHRVCARMRVKCRGG